MTALLEARRLTKRFGGGVFDRKTTLALDEFSITIDGQRPSITAVVGESGSGKTTLARLLLGLVTPTHGQVLYDGRDLQTMGAPDWRAFRHDVQVIFQDPYEVYNPFYRVDHVLTTPVSKFKLAATKAEARTVIEEALRASAGNQRQAARALGVLPTTLHEKMKRLGLLRREAAPAEAVALAG